MVGMLFERGWRRNIWISSAIMILGTAVIFVFGIAGLTMTAGFINALEMGLFPFIPGAILKILFAVVLTSTLNRTDH
jgi:biotin transporter BioY